MNPLGLFSNYYFIQKLPQAVNRIRGCNFSSIAKAIGFPWEKHPRSLQHASFSTLTKTRSFACKSPLTLPHRTLCNKREASLECNQSASTGIPLPITTTEPASRNDALMISTCNGLAFLHDSTTIQDAAFTKRLRLHDLRDRFFYGSLMIELHRSPTGINGECGSPYLLAYDMHTENEVWRTPSTLKPISDPSMPDFAKIKSHNYHIKRMENRLSFQYIDEKKIYFIQLDTGKVDSTVELIETSKNSSSLHISPTGDYYQVVEKGKQQFIYGGKILNQRLESSFAFKAPHGTFHAFSTHCGFRLYSSDDLVVIGPRGELSTIENCLTAHAHNDKLYTIEKDPAHKDKSLFRIRTLKCKGKATSDVETTIPLEIKNGYFGKVCSNQQVILFTKNYFTPVFIDLKSQNVSYHEHKFSSHTINPNNGELWTWNEREKEVWQLSFHHALLAGSLKDNSESTRLHVDDLGRLYLIDLLS